MSDLAQDTELLLHRATKGDAMARRDLLEHYRDYLRRMVAARLDRRLAPRIDASDVVQETLADAAQRLDEYLSDPPLPFFGWLRVLAGEHVREAHRQHLVAKGRSVARESRIPELNDMSMLTLTQQLASNDTSPSNRLMRQEELELAQGQPGRPVVAGSRSARHALHRSTRLGRNRPGAGDDRGPRENPAVSRADAPAEPNGRGPVIGRP